MHHLCIFKNSGVAHMVEKLLFLTLLLQRLAIREKNHRFYCVLLSLQLTYKCSILSSNDKIFFFHHYHPSWVFFSEPVQHCLFPFSQEWYPWNSDIVYRLYVHHLLWPQFGNKQSKQYLNYRLFANKIPSKAPVDYWLKMLDLKD